MDSISELNIEKQLEELLDKNRDAMKQVQNDLFDLGEAPYHVDKDGKVTVPKWYVVE